LSLTIGHVTEAVGTDCVPTVSTKINKDFGSKGFFKGEATLGPCIRKMCGNGDVVWKLGHAKDGDCEEMTVSEIAWWKAPVKEVHALKPKLKHARQKKTMAAKPSGDQSEELEDALPQSDKDASAPNHQRRSASMSPTKSARNGVNEFPRQQSTCNAPFSR